MLFQKINQNETSYEYSENIFLNVIRKSEEIHQKTDVMIIGGGLLGFSCGLELLKMGFSVTIIDKEQIGAKQSARSGGQLWPGFEMSFSEMFKKYGKTISLEAHELIHQAIIEIHQKIEEIGDCDFVSGLLLMSKTNQQKKWIDSEVNILQKYQLDAQYIEKNKINNYINTEYYHNGVIFGENKKTYCHLNPKKYLFKIVKKYQELGGLVFEKCEAIKINKKNHHYEIITNQWKIEANQVILGTGAEAITFIQKKRTIIPLQTIIVCSETISKELANQLLPKNNCFCDASDISMNYGRIIKVNQEYKMTLGGADALTQITKSLDIIKIKKELIKIFPIFEQIKIENIWGGKCDVTLNNLPFIDEIDNNLYIAHGFSGQGLVATHLYAKAIVESICENKDKINFLKNLNPDNYHQNKIMAMLQKMLNTI